MGYERHHTIIVTTFDLKRAMDARDKAFSYFGDNGQLTTVYKSPVNLFFTFAILTDGSKEGWSESDIGDYRREQFLSWLNKQRYADGSTAFRWAEVQYGDDEGDDRVLRTQETDVPPLADAT